MKNTGEAKMDDVVGVTVHIMAPNA